MFRYGLLLLAFGLNLFFVCLSFASEFPERECCDPVYQLPAAATTNHPQAITPTNRPGTNVKTAIAILNCLLARQLCYEDSSCADILQIIPRVCGPELVACSTVTVTKCQAALRTLQAFPFFKPTCLCREPHVDPECNSFRDYLFDHPCIFVFKKEKDPYPVDALPTCNHALSVCQQETKCIKLFEDFKYNCKVREDKCRMDDRELCHAAWTNLRLSPMFGCICPNNHMKRRCDRIFNMVNHNPCVDVSPAFPELSTAQNAHENQAFWMALYTHFPLILPSVSHKFSLPYSTGTNGTKVDLTLGTRQSVQEPNYTSVKHDDRERKLISSYSGSISVKEISMENSPPFDFIQAQIENPLLGLTEDKEKKSQSLKTGAARRQHLRV